MAISHEEVLDGLKDRSNLVLKLMRPSAHDAFITTSCLEDADRGFASSPMRHSELLWRMQVPYTG